MKLADLIKSVVASVNEANLHAQEKQFEQIINCFSKFSDQDESKISNNLTNEIGEIKYVSFTSISNQDGVKATNQHNIPLILFKNHKKLGVTEAKVKFSVCLQSLDTDSNQLELTNISSINDNIITQIELELNLKEIEHNVGELTVQKISEIAIHGERFSQIKE